MSLQLISPWDTVMHETRSWLTSHKILSAVQIFLVNFKWIASQEEQKIISCSHNMLVYQFEKRFPVEPTTVRRHPGLDI